MQNIRVVGCSLNTAFVPGAGLGLDIVNSRFERGLGYADVNSREKSLKDGTIQTCFIAVFNAKGALKVNFPFSAQCPINA